MEYDPSFDSLVCSACGNIVDPMSLPDADDFYHDTEQPVDIEDTLDEFAEFSNEMYDTQVYKCSQCGGEVLVTHTEISTRCIYCGATAVVFSRIDQSQRPDLIVPFSITKETAMENLKEKLLSGAFIPKEFKQIDPECVRGIYIPYYTYSGTIKDTQHHSWRSFIGSMEGCVLDGSAEFENLLVECCTILNDRSTALLEPYNLKEAVDFDTSYLMGFYSNVQDSSNREANSKADLKARTLFHAKMRDSSPNRLMKQINSLPIVDLHRTAYVMLPAWFITISMDGTPYTFLVNGQTGKVSGTAPWSKKSFFGWLIGIPLAISALLFVLWRTVIHDYIFSLSDQEASDVIVGSKLQIGLGLCVILCIPFLCIVVKKLRTLLQKRQRAGSVLTSMFSRKRQGGVRS